MNVTSNELSSRVALGCAALFIVAVAIFLLSIIGAFFVIGAREMHRQAHLMKVAEEVEVTIISSDVVRSVHTSGSGTGASRTRREVFIPKIVFTFERGGRLYRGDRIHPSPHSEDEPWARSMTRRYPPGATATAWIDPEAPEDAFLEKQWVLGPYWIFVAASIGLGVLSAMAAVVTFFWPRISRTAAFIGVAAWLIGPLYAAAHFWINPHADATQPAGARVPEDATLAIIALVILVTAAIPYLGWRQGRRWQRKLTAADAGA